MGHAVMISIRPKWCDLIASGKKTIEVRKTRPKLETPFKCYIYETKRKTDVPTFIDEDGHYIYDGRGQVIGEFVCDGIITVDCDSINLFNRETGEYIHTETSLSREELWKYTKGLCALGWHITDLVIYDKPKELSEFLKPCHYGDVSCFLCDKSGYNDDMHIDCFNRLTRPPQSWCYVEEV